MVETTLKSDWENGNFKATIEATNDDDNMIITISLDKGRAYKNSEFFHVCQSLMETISKLYGEGEI